MMNRMRKAGWLMLALFAAVIALGVTSWRLHRAARPEDLALCFHPFVGQEPLILNEARYPNPGGEGRFKVRDFQFFLSNIRLLSASGEFVESDSYHLVRFDGEESTSAKSASADRPGFVITLHDVPRRSYERIEFGIGVDAAANRSLAQRGDLDPNGRMAWNWEVGYKFVLFEGTLLRGDRSDPLVYHVGFSENYRPMSIELHRDSLNSRPVKLDFRVDLLRLFQGSTNVDMAALPSVKFDRADAALLGRNFPGMVKQMWPDAASRPNGDR
jgi:methanobactin biosynthesis MbnP-like protein